MDAMSVIVALEHARARPFGCDGGEAPCRGRSSSSVRARSRRAIAGPLDDAIVAALVLRHVLRRTDRSILAEHWRGEPSTLDVIIRLGRPRVV
jgi:hypothetical protein